MADLAMHGMNLQQKATCNVNMPVCRGELAVSKQLRQEFHDTVSDSVRAPGVPKPLVHQRPLSQPPVTPLGHVLRPPCLQKLHWNRNTASQETDGAGATPCDSSWANWEWRLLTVLFLCLRELRGTEGLICLPLACVLMFGAPELSR